ncbi:unnamed protein product [Polarella glacialis]|uniref:Uncharacterized protein n=1 Tax=Polarella glacialis TaxID=89957 RepID=A0A813DY83_POLGL|nr:unnamed protein product [Polarella glacialis]
MKYLTAALATLWRKSAQSESNGNGLGKGLLRGNDGKSQSLGVTGVEEPPLHYATMGDIREIAAFGVIVVALLVALNREVLCPGWDAGEAFRVLYVLTLAAEFAIWSDEFCGHVDWLNTSRFTDRRGLGKWASPIYGLFRIPALSLGMFALALVTLVVSLVVAVYVKEVVMLSFLLACIVMTHLFWNRQNIGGHGGLPVLHTLFCLCLLVEGNEAVVRICIATFMGFSYMGSALCKLVTSLLIQRPRQWWGNGDGLKFYLLDSVSIRPMRGIRRDVRSAIITAGPSLRPVLDLAMNAALIFELAVPALICMDARGAAVLLFAFHYSVWFLFDIDFMSYWAPSLLALAVDNQTLLSPAAVFQAVESAWEVAPYRTAVLLAYTMLQVLASVFVFDLNPRRGELLPFSAYPMFEEATRLFEDNQAMALVLRVPTAVPIPEPYYLRMQALSNTESEHFISGPRILDAAGQRMLAVGIPRQAEPNPKAAGLNRTARHSPDVYDYVGGVWRPQTRPKNRIESCANGIASLMGQCGRVTDCSNCTVDAEGSHALNHERECSAESSGAVILSSNVEISAAMPEVEQLVTMLAGMTTKDAWRPDKMRELLDAYDAAEAALQRCPRIPVAFRLEHVVDLASRSPEPPATPA